MKWIIGASVFGIASVLLIIYFNVFDVRDSKAFSSGDYRTIESGEWGEAHVWEVFDGTEWTPASLPPGTAASKIWVTTGNHLTISEEIPLSQLVIDSGAVVTLESNTMRVAKVNGAGGIVCHGRFAMNSCIIEGDGDFSTGPHAVLMIGSDAGISRRGGEGNIQLRGKRELHRETRFVYNGTIRQKTGNGLPAVINELVIDNLSGVELDVPVRVTGTLTLEKGVLFTGKNMLELGASVAEMAKFNSNGGAVSGKWDIWYRMDEGMPMVFPLSDGTHIRKYAFNAVYDAYRKGMISLVYREGIPDDERRSPFEARQVIIGLTESGHFGAMLSNGPEEAWLELQPVSAIREAVTWNIRGKDMIRDAQAKPGRARTFQNLLTGPEPFHEVLVVRLYCEEPTFAVIQLTQSNGNAVYKETVQAESGYNQFEVIVKPEIEDGTYTLQLSNMNDIHTCKVTKLTPSELTQLR
jgi:hypothetical protein